MRIGLISDTHIPGAARALPPEVAHAFRNVDLILHAGDVYLPHVLDELECLAPVLAACGDDDYGGTCTDRRVKEKHVLRLEGQVLWLVHESPYFHLTTPRKANEESEADRSDSPNIVVFGHSHYPSVNSHNGILFVNPGSPTFLNYRTGLGTVALLDPDSGAPRAEILQL